MSKRATALPAIDVTPDGFVAELETAPARMIRLTWTKADEAIIARYYPLGKDPRLIGKCLSVPKSANAVYNKAKMLGLRFGSALKGEGQ